MTTSNTICNHRKLLRLAIGLLPNRSHCSSDVIKGEHGFIFTICKIDFLRKLLNDKKLCRGRYLFIFDICRNGKFCE